MPRSTAREPVAALEPDLMNAVIFRLHKKFGIECDPALWRGIDGLPVRSWVFPGQTNDITTVEKVKEACRELLAY